MELRSCSKCGRAFGAEADQTLCTKCTNLSMSETFEEDFRKVRNYLYENPGADVREVHEQTGVTQPVIIKLLKDGRIEIVEDTNLLLKCERCGGSIKSGRWCEPCYSEVAHDLRQAAADYQTKRQAPPSGAKKEAFHLKR